MTDNSNSDIYTSYLEHLGELTGVLDQLTRIAHEKTAAVQRGDLMKLSDCMKQEQVQSLTLRGMDQKREKMLAAMGLSGVRLSALAARYPADRQREARQAAEKLQNTWKIYQSASKVAQHTLECSLHEVERMLAAEEQRAAAAPSPSPSAPNPAPAPPHPGGMTDFRA